MTAQSGQIPNPTPPTGNEQEPPAQPALDTQPQPQTFPLEYVQQLRQEAAGYRTKLKEFEEAQRNKHEQELAEQNKWKELAEQRAAKLAELEPTAQAYAQMIETMKASNAKRIEAIPEASRTLVPEYDDPAKLAAWLDANAALLNAKPIAPSLNGAAGGNYRPGAAPPVLSDEELTVAKKMGLTPEQYAESKLKIKTR